MKQPPTIPGFHLPNDDGFEEILNRLKIASNTKSDRALSVSLGLKHAAAAAAKARSQIPASWIVEAVRRFNVSTSWLLLGTEVEQSSDDFCLLPILKPFLTAENDLDIYKPNDSYLFKRNWLEDKGSISDLYLLRNTGRAMEPIIHDKDMVLINIGDSEVTSESAIFLVAFNQSLFIRRIAMEPGKIIIRAENTALAPDVAVSLEEKQLVKIWGRVVWWAHEAV